MDPAMGADGAAPAVLRFRAHVGRALRLRPAPATSRPGRR
jgi:hypothetical protein